jgi:hypothetical protein
LAFGTCLLIYLWRAPWTRRQKWQLVGIFSGVVLVLVLPYFYKVYLSLGNLHTIPTSAGHNTRWGDGRNLWWVFVRTQIFGSTWGAKTFLEPVGPLFHEFVGPLLASIFQKDIIGWFPKLFAIIYLFRQAYRLVRGQRMPVSEIFITLSFFILLLVFQYLNIPTEPHYYQSVWYLVFAGSIALLFSLRNRWHTLGLALLSATILINVAYIVSTTWFIHINHGTRGNHHGSTIVVEHDVTKRLCELMREKQISKAEIDLSAVFMPDHPVEYFKSILPECQGLELTYTKQSSPHSVFKIIYPENSRTDADLQIIYLR